MKKPTLTTDFEWVLGNDIFCFDLVRGMDKFDRHHELIYADIRVDKDFHNNKKFGYVGNRQPYEDEEDDDDEDVDDEDEEDDDDEDVDDEDDGNYWSFYEDYYKDNNFRATKFETSNGTTVRVRHWKQGDLFGNLSRFDRRDEMCFRGAVVNVGDNYKVKFVIIPNQVLIRALLVLVLKRSSNPFGKLSIEMFRLLKLFFE
jgi:hypothetical protein